MVYLIFEILWFLVAAAGLGVLVGWLCRSLTTPRRPKISVPRTRAEQSEQEGRREQLEARLTEAVDGRKALQEELARVRQAAEAEALALRKLEQEHRNNLEAREREVAQLNAELETRRGQIAVPLPPHTVTSQLTPGPLEVVSPESGSPPRGLVAPQGAADDLKRITGVGQGIERALNENGIFHYRQIAELTAPNLVWLDRHLRLKGRIEREDWIGQARALLAEHGLAELGPLAGQK